MGSSNLQGANTMTGEDMWKIHQAMLQIASNPGFEIHLNEKEFRRLDDLPGFKVDLSKKRVFLEEEPILETIRQFNGAKHGAIDRNGSQKPDQPLRLPKKLLGSIGSHHGYVYHVDKQEQRPTTHRDVKEFISLRQALPHVIKNNIGLVPLDVPAKVSLVHAMAMNAIYQKNPAIVTTDGPVDRKWVLRIMDVARPGAGVDYAQTTFVTPPLRLLPHAVEMMRLDMKKGLMPYVLTMGTILGNGPVTVAGTLAVTLAEIFGFNTIVRALCPESNNTFTPRAVGCDNALIDPRSGNAVFAAEEGLLNTAQRQMMGAFYKMPGGSGWTIRGTGNSPVPDIQAAMEFAVCSSIEMMGGFYSYDEKFTAVVKSLGRLASNLSICMEKTIMDYEFFLWMKRYAEGFAVNEHTLAVDTIRQVGPGGCFMAADHTLDYYKEHLWQPKMLFAGTFPTWKSAGGKTLTDVARDQADKIRKQEPQPVLKQEQIREIESLVRAAEKELLDANTGVSLR